MLKSLSRCYHPLRHARDAVEQGIDWLFWRTVWTAVNLNCYFLAFQILVVCFFPLDLIKCVAHFAMFVCRKSDPAISVSEKYDIIIANWVVILHLTCSGGQWPLGFVHPLLVVLSETQGTKGAVYAAGSGAAGRQWVAPPSLRCHLCQWPKIQHLWPQCDCQPKLNTG